jgi:hypothetical protein
MWIFTRDGFISAVYKYEGVQVRARDKESLRRIADFCHAEIRHSPHADYPYRVSTDRETMAQFVSNEVMHMDYSNFKSEVHDVRGLAFVRPLHKVWDVMHDVEDDEARVKM